MSQPKSKSKSKPSKEYNSKYTYLEYKFKGNRNGNENGNGNGNRNSKPTINEIWWDNIILPLDKINECQICKKYHALMVAGEDPDDDRIGKQRCTPSCLWFEWFEYLRQNQ